MENITVVEYKEDTHIKYPAVCLGKGLHNSNLEISLPDSHGDYIRFGDNGKFRHRGYDIHHVETLPTYERLVRGIVEHKGVSYVFSARMTTLHIGTLNYDKLLEAAIESVDKFIDDEKGAVE